MTDAIIDFLGFQRYYGLDWAAAVFMFLSMYRLGIHKKDGFLFAALASACWIAFNLLAKSPAGVVANLIIAVMAVRSLMLWKRPAGTTESVNPAEIRPTDTRPEEG